MAIPETKTVTRFPPCGTGCTIGDGRTAFDAKVDDYAHGLHEGDAVEGKLIIVGNFAVGKTALALRHKDGNFIVDYKATIGVEFYQDVFRVLGATFNLSLWDTAGQERFRALSSLYYRNAHAALVCFDLSDPRTLEDTEKWHTEIKDTGEDIVGFLVGCKSDLPHHVKREEGEAMAKKLGLEYWEVSSKDNINVNELFARVAAIVFEKSVLEKLSGGRKKSGVKVKQRSKRDKTPRQEKSGACC